MEKLGLSGDTLLIKGDRIHKICETDQQRFIKNIEKQLNFKNKYIKAVPILEQGITSDGKNFIQMPYLQCGHAVIWLSRATTNSIYQLEESLLKYFQSIFSNSELQEFDSDIWKNKIINLESKIEDKELFNILQILKNHQFTQDFYYGNYHGDLTLTNLLISNDGTQIEIDAIDFLESFIHSPINDIIKIRQDTKHLWTLNLIKNIENIDINRVIIVLQHIDKKIESLIENNKNISNFYLPFQILNFMRIIPYNKDEELFLYLKKEIIGLFDDFYTNNVLCGKIEQISGC